MKSPAVLGGVLVFFILNFVEGFVIFFWFGVFIGRSVKGVTRFYRISFSFKQVVFIIISIVIFLMSLLS